MHAIRLDDWDPEIDNDDEDDDHLYHQRQPARCLQCSFWSKYSLFALNVLIWLGGVMMIGVGIWSHLDHPNLVILTRVKQEPAALLIIIGCVMFTLSFVVCVGALRENLILLKIFSITLSLVFVLQIVAGVIAFSYIDSVKTAIMDSLRIAITQYEDDSRMRRAMDTIQKFYGCCGATDSTDWELNEYYNCSSPAMSRCGVPPSCCIASSDQMCGHQARHGQSFVADSVYTEGCLRPLMSIYRNNLYVVGLIAFAVGFLEVLSLLLACSLMRDIVATQKRCRYATSTCLRLY